jgi:hypothetical protein
MPLLGSYNGWHHACFSAAKYPCAEAEDDCSRAPGASPTNYYTCAQCRNRAWFASKITTFRGDDIVRAEAGKRMKALEPIKVHKEMRKLHAEFTKRGGIIRVLGNAVDMPAVVWGKSGKFIVSATWPPHLRTTELYGTKRLVARAEAAPVLQDPFAEESADT